ncbi:class I SAM-dependent methyltransferase [Nitrospira lenta]|uniref:Class I SAM-dependent methyltransferase n=1 Tax=Nitrospira lenta TaxID=1436998 RepID=A0A330L702_9BACT|nr:class I SAM-dependent methyltransferase [Nitrospira lenta]SPP65633.1 hypothetical protein NITLEN_40106 [Nitrospira lenta]
MILSDVKRLVYDYTRVRTISARGPGYSALSHYRFFRHIMASLASAVGKQPRRCLIVGVYFGRDIMMMADVLAREFPALATTVHIVGVDKFEDAPCDDWPEEARRLSWAEAGFGAAPSLEQTQRIIQPHFDYPQVELIRSRAEDYLESAPSAEFDWIYIDTAHDYESTCRIMRLAMPALKKNGILSGDDYSNAGTWGVQRAVQEVCPDHFVWDNWIWYSRVPQCP